MPFAPFRSWCVSYFSSATSRIPRLGHPWAFLDQRHQNPALSRMNLDAPSRITITQRSVRERLSPTRCTPHAQVESSATPPALSHETRRRGPKRWRGRKALRCAGRGSKRRCQGAQRVHVSRRHGRWRTRLYQGRLLLLLLLRPSSLLRWRRRRRAVSDRKAQWPALPCVLVPRAVEPSHLPATGQLTHTKLPCCAESPRMRVHGALLLGIRVSRRDPSCALHDGATAVLHHVVADRARQA